MRKCILMNCRVDGIETDGNVKSVIRSIAGQKGIKVDTVHFPDEQTADVQILGVNYPETTIRHGESFELSLDILSTYEGEAVLSMYDDATQIGESVRIRLAKGAQSVKLDAIVPIPGLHKLTFEIESASDLETRNNVYNSHLYIETFDKLLVIESIDGVDEAVVFLTLDCSSEYVYRDDGASDFLILSGGDGEEAVRLCEIYPRVRGIAVVCTGGELARIKETVTELLSAALGLPYNKIKVAGS